MPLVLHSSSHCDVCLDRWDIPERPPYVISCGHIFCRECLNSLEARSCPLCRKSFLLGEIKKLHVDLADTKDLLSEPALRLLQRVALVSGDDSSEAEIAAVVDEAKEFLAHEDQPSEYQPLRAAIEALDRFRTLGQDLESQATTFDEKKRSLKHKLRNYRADVMSLRAAERHLLDQLSQSHEDNRRFKSELAGAQMELARLRRETTEPSQYRNSNSNNPLPAPPEPVPFDVIPPLTTVKGIPYHGSRAAAYQGHRRRTDSSTSFTHGERSSADSRGRDHQGSTEKAPQKREKPMRSTSYVEAPSQSLSHPGVRHGAVPHVHWSAPPASSSPWPALHVKGKGKEMDKGGSAEWPTSRPDTLGRSFTTAPDGFGPDLTGASAAYASGYYGKPQYAGGYAPNYQENRSFTRSPSHLGPLAAQDQRGPVTLQNPPESADGISHVAPSRLYDPVTSSSLVNGMTDMSLLQATRRPPTASTQTVGDMLNESHARPPAHERRDHVSSSSRSHPTDQSFGTEPVRSRDNTLGHSDWQGVPESNNGAPRVANGTMGVGGVSLSAPYPSQSSDITPTFNHLGASTRHSRSTSHHAMPGDGRTETHRSSMPSESSARDRRHSTQAHALTHADVGTKHAVFQVVPRPETVVAPQTSRSPSPNATNALALTLGPPLEMHERGVGTTAVAATGGVAMIHAPTPRAGQNPLHKWGLGT